MCVFPCSGRWIVWMSVFRLGTTHTHTHTHTQLVDICMQTLLDVTLLSCWVVVVFTSSRTSARPDGRRYMHTATQRDTDLTHSHDNTVDLYSRHDHFKRKTCYSCFLAWSCTAGGPEKVGNSNPTIPTTACHAWRLHTENHMDQFHNNWADLIQDHSKASCHSWIFFFFPSSFACFGVTTVRKKVDKWIQKWSEFSDLIKSFESVEKWFPGTAATCYEQPWLVFYSAPSCCAKMADQNNSDLFVCYRVCVTRSQ